MEMIVFVFGIFFCIYQIFKPTKMSKKDSDYIASLCEDLLIDFQVKELNIHKNEAKYNSKNYMSKNYKVLRHKDGEKGVFKETKNGYHGEITIIKTFSGREFYAPSDEFSIIY